MTAPTPLSLFEPIYTISVSEVVGPPRFRRTDPSTSREAAERVKPGNSDLIKAIRFTARVGIGIPAEPITAFDIARYIERDHPGRWCEATIRTAIARAGLHAVDTEGRSPRGSRCLRFTLGRV